MFLIHYLGACTIDNFAFGGGDILISGFHNLQPSWEECQKSCQAITNCQYWSYFKPDYDGTSKNYCELKFEDGGIPLPGVISGPKNCWEKNIHIIWFFNQ